jgi:DHA1 family multidrug resistance protein-like MFS transporter
MKKHLFILLACLFVVNIGFGITLPVLAFYTERLALAEGASGKAAAMHVGLLTSVYALMQLVFAPLWGRLSDRFGRKLLLLLGIAGYATAQALFGIAANLWLLYAARIVGGIFSAATVTAATAYIADKTDAETRTRGMAWLGTAVSLGVVVGPALGGVLARSDWHFSASFGHFVVDGFSIPFFTAAILALLTLPVAVRRLPESLAAKTPAASEEKAKIGWRELESRLRPLLALAFIGQFGLALFEAIFALYAGAKFGYGPVEVGAIFIVCGLVMAIFQTVMVGFFAGRVGEIYQIAAGFVLMGGSLAMITASQTTPTVFALVGVMAFGMALIAPNLTALVSKRMDGSNTGAAIGAQNAANSLGQFGGPVLGGALFAVSVGMPFLLAGIALLATGLVVFRQILFSPVSAAFRGIGQTGEEKN